MTRGDPILYVSLNRHRFALAKKNGAMSLKFLQHFIFQSAKNRRRDDVQCVLEVGLMQQLCEMADSGF